MAAYSTPRGALGMLFTVFVLLQAVVASHHHAHHPVRRSDEAHMEAHLQETRAALQARADNIAIKGAGDNGSYPRLEIRQLEQNADQWNLYLLAMESFKAKPTDDPMSYYSIAGVHGRPFKSWNNEGPILNRAGHCPHAHPLFGSWHRPYLSIFEQALYLNAAEVVQSFPANQRQKWSAALTGLRMPYFDWALESGDAVPMSILNATVTVTTPNGTVAIDNPLASYNWGDSLPAEMGSDISVKATKTLRRPTGGVSNNQDIVAVFAQARTSWRQRLFGLFASKADWGRVSTEAFGGVDTKHQRGDSFESVHDAIHSLVGGTGGHMSYLDIAAFDPIFWLHHTNVDRLLAMHQMLTPNTWTAAGPINNAMAQWQMGEQKDRNSPLKPFTKNTNGDYFTSMDVKETRTLGYFYPETEQRTAMQVKLAVNKLYGAGERVGVVKRDAAAVYPGRAFKEGDYDTVMSVVGNKYLMAGAYSVHCYLGNKPTNGSTNSTVPAKNTTTPATNGTTCGFEAGYVGTHTFLGHSMAGDKKNPVMVEGTIPLTAALQEKQEKGELKSLCPEDVEPYLKENLHYKVIGPDGKEMDADCIDDFHVQVKSCPVTPSKGDELPSYGDYKEVPVPGLPASKPWTYTPGPNAFKPQETSPVYPQGEAPWSEPGYCVSEQVIVYVDESGKLLYEEKS